MSGAPLLTLEQVEVTYHRVITAVQGVTLKVEHGQIVALLGTMARARQRRCARSRVSWAWTTRG